MAWIEVREPGDAEGPLADTYRELEKKRGKIANILTVQSLNPEALADHVRLYMTIMFGKSELSRAEREAIGVVVSSANDCAYCVNHHLEALRAFIKDPDTLDIVASADGLETLEPRLAAITRHANKLTSAPSAMTEDDVDELHAVGLNDGEILDITLITAYFNFVNRIALGLGVEFSDEELRGYHNE